MDADASAVALVAVDEAVLEQLVQAATSDAGANEVTPPLNSGEDWTPARIEWLRDFHRARRAGLDGPAGEATWAIVVASAVVGAARLKRTGEDGVVEAGVWVTRSSRGSGVATAAVAAVLRRAAELGAYAVRAETTAGNVGALALLRRLGFELTAADDGCGVRAVLVLSPAKRSPDPGG